MKLAFAKKIRQLRLLKNHTVKEVAFYLEIDASTYHRLESGKSSNWLKYLPKLLEFYKINEEQLFLGLPEDVVARKAVENNHAADSYLLNFFQKEIEKRDDLLNGLKKDLEQLRALNDKQFKELRFLKKNTF
ncbi:helix-turn-helix domain-containing protein [Flavobacterium aurantiibacter]|uniref:HTH cro/C1-type domain-containing protein n=1 Tax=Flavobacterium aurantiibacter TaxID=2023067 RepID=A0A255ZJ16_9FLAO|nr:helix-turn-helix transcriptional regulator [Flavobacterium aurantiibacter]OYQ41533.1 hypothetical protein CHX27_12740 [Flavobacterium aurantiibacter]